MKKFFVKLIIILLASGGYPLYANLTHEQLTKLLQQADNSRGGGIPGIVWDIEVENIENGQSSSEFSVHVKAKNEGESIMALVEFVKPNKYRKQRFLLKNYNMWFAKPGLRRAVPISIRQRLSGNASNADIVAANYVNDYNATFLRNDKLNDEECYVIDLIANKSLVSYYHIVYWVSKKSHLGLKAEFFGKSGKPLKHALFTYNNQLNPGTSPIPFVSEVKIVDHLDKSSVTLLKLSNVELQALSSNIFQTGNLLD